jgi:hypothetical protein
MITYEDLGYNNLLTKEPNAPTYLGGQNTNYIGELSTDQLLTVGKIQSPNGKFYIDFENEDIFLPDQAVKTTQINYASRSIKAVVSLTGGGDYTDIQQAIDYVNRQGGGTILIKEGVYVLSKDITLYGQISLLGEGIDSTILDFNNSSLNSINIVGASSLSRSENVSISNLTIKNNHTSTGSIYIKWGINISIEKIKFKDNRTGTTGLDIYVEETQLLTVQNCIADSGAGFIKIRDTDESNLIFNNYIDNYNNIIFEGELSSGLGAKHVTFEKNWINDYSSTVFSGDFIYCNFVSNTAFYKTGTLLPTMFFLFTSSHDNHILNNYFEGASSARLVSVNGNYNRFSNNGFFNYETTPTMEVTGNRNIIVGNHLGDEPEAAIYVTGDINVITGNIIEGDVYGILIHTTADKTVVAGNYITASTDIQNNGTNTTSGTNG